MLAIKTLFNTHEIYWAKSSREARELYLHMKFDWALVDVDLEEKSIGLILAHELSKQNVRVTMVTGHRSEDFLNKAIRAGASEVLSKPFDPGELRELIHTLDQESSLEVQKLKSYLEVAAKNGREAFQNVASSIIREIPILLTGQSGTGKTRLARLIHQTFCEEGAPFLHLNCAEIPESLAESTLFGHVKGAFSGADQNRVGVVELAHNGTLFLDEVATLSPKLQAKLLKVLETKSFRQVGGDREKSVRFNLMSATCEDVESAEFRRDLFFRIAGTKVELLPLIKAKGLALSISKEILDSSSKRMILTNEAKEYLANLDLEGNIRELVIGMKKVMGLCKIRIEQGDLIAIFNRNDHSEALSFREQVTHFERTLVKKTFRACGESVRQTLRELEITSSTFYRVMNLQGTVH